MTGLTEPLRGYKVVDAIYFLLYTCDSFFTLVECQTILGHYITYYRGG